MMILAFGAATFILICQSILFPSFGLFPYAPFLALAILTRPFAKALWCAVGSALVLDLLSGEPHGIFLLTHCSVTLVCFRYKKHFLFQNPLHLSLFTIFISFASTLITLFFLFLFDRRVPFSGKWVFVDLLVMPMADGVYSLIGFSLPISLYTQFRSKGFYLWQTIKEKLSPPTP